MRQFKSLTLMVFLLTNLCSLALAEQLPLKCQTSGQSYILHIQQNTVSFMLPVYREGRVSKRLPASSSFITNKVQGQDALEIVTYFETRRFKVFLNLKNENYKASTVSIRTRSGHETSLPITCQEL